MKKYKNKILFIALAIVYFINAMPVFSEFRSLTEQVRYYEDRYTVTCTDQKITDNFGNGFPALYGTRNMRPILHGVAYRGGANNFYHSTGKRDNHNPLPADGLLNLCMEGFSDAVYLYSTNFASAEKSIKSDSNNLSYHQISGNSRAEIKEIIEMVYNVINRKLQGPIYFHCWNGWHQSGYVSAALLKQFCNYCNNEAVQYWVNNTDGVSVGYDAVKAKVRDFTPFDEFKIPKEVSQEICPCKKRK